jgi:hypothetical protein
MQQTLMQRPLMRQRWEMLMLQLCWQQQREMHW